MNEKNRECYSIATRTAEHDFAELFRASIGGSREAQQKSQQALMQVATLAQQDRLNARN